MKRPPRKPVACWQDMMPPPRPAYCWHDNGRPMLMKRDPAPVSASRVLVKQMPAHWADGARKPQAGRRGDAPTLMAADRSTSAIVQAGDYGRRHLLAAARNGGFAR